MMANEQLQSQLEKLQADNAELQRQLVETEGKVKDVCKVSAKLPAFWSDKPALWFAQVEAQFILAGIVAESTKYNYIIGQLDQRTAIEVEDLIINSPVEDPYTKLKNALIQRLSVSQEKRVRQLLSDEELGDRKPSQFLRHLRSLAGTAFSDDDIVRQLWLRRLPGLVPKLFWQHRLTLAWIKLLN